MKIKFIAILLLSAVITLSFTYSSKHKAGKKAAAVQSSNEAGTIGGLASADPIN